MKKFLTMLLALSVVFTYTFGAAGSVFAATEVSDGSEPSTLVEKIDEAKKELKEEAKTEVAKAKVALKATYTETFGAATDVIIEKASYEATLDQIEKDLIGIVDKAALDSSVTSLDNATSDVDAVKDAIKLVEVDNVFIVGDKYYKSTYPLVMDVIDEITVKPTDGAKIEYKHYAILTWNNALDGMKAQIKAEIEKLDLDLYTSDVVPAKDAVSAGAGAGNPYNKTWNDLAKDAKDAMIKTVDDTEINVITDGYKGATSVGAKIETMYGVLAGLTIEDSDLDIDGKTIVKSYRLTNANIKTKDDLEKGAAEDAASKKALVATVAAKVADETSTALETYNAADKSTAAKAAAAKAAYNSSLDNIAAWEEVLTYVINNDLDITVTGGSDYSTLDKAHLDAVTDVDNAKWVAVVEKYNEYVALAEGLKVIVEKDGSLKYDATKIDKNLAGAKDTIYATVPATTYVEADAKAVLIINADATVSNFDWNKTVALAAINNEMKDALYDADGEDKFYAPEKAKVEAAYQKKIDAINAATTQDQLDVVAPNTAGVFDTFVNVGSIAANKTSVVNKLKGYTVVTDDFIDAVNEYIGYLNFGLAATDAGIRNTISKSVDSELEAVAKFLAENGARIKTDVAGMMSKAKDYAASLPTIGETEALAKAAKDAIDALPATVTLADKATVEAAYEAFYKTGATVVPTRLANAIATVKTAEEKSIDTLKKAISTPITVADKAAIEAFTAAVKAYKATAMYTSYKAYDVDTPFVALRDAAKKDVIDTIAALPTDATKEQVEAARAKADAFVADYTDAEEPYNAIVVLGQANLDKLVIAEATIEAKEKAEAEKAALETKLAVKDTTARFASSKAYKNSIKLTFKKPAVGVDGYKVYMATKKNGLYKLVGTTTTNTFTKKNLKKGTSYYFKVKAYKVVGEEKVYTQTSGKLCKKTTK